MSKKYVHFLFLDKELRSKILFQVIAVDYPIEAKLNAVIDLKSEPPSLLQSVLTPIKFTTQRDANRAALKHPEMKRLLSDKSTKFDIVLNVAFYGHGNAIGLYLAKRYEWLKSIQKIHIEYFLECCRSTFHINWYISFSGLVHKVQYIALVKWPPHSWILLWVCPTTWQCIHS